MADPFVGELRLVGFSFAPKHWATADGQLMAISQNTALFSLLGTNFGGNGSSTFGLPNLQGSIPIGAGQGPGLSLYDVGEAGGVPAVTLLQTEMPAHTHTVMADAQPANTSAPAANTFAQTKASAGSPYSATSSGSAQMNPGIVTNFGNNLPHNNLMPYLTLNWIIALYGVFPPRD